MEAESRKPRKIRIFTLAGGIAALVLILCAVFFLLVPAVQRRESQAEVVSISTLQEIVNVSELSTFTAVYNGIADVPNPENPDEIDYYVSYEAKVNAGIDFSRVLMEKDDEEKVIRMTIPEVEITEINVDIGSLDFIFYNNSANTSTVTQQAFKACEQDVREESAQQREIYELAQQNAKNIVTALAGPLIEQADDGYRLIVE